MDAHRYRWGGLAWLLTLQFFVVEAIAAARYGGYSYSVDVISDLGTADSSARVLMNSSFVLQGLLIAAGALLLGPGLAGTGGRLARVLFVVSGVGVLLVGLVPSDSNATVHEIAAGAHLLGGSIGLIALAYAVRPRSEALGTTLALLGLVGTAATVFFLTGVTEYLGEGGTERVAGYVLPLGLALAGTMLWRIAGPRSADRPDRRAERDAARADRAERALERDAALEAAARRDAGTTAPGPGDPAGESDPETDDPWATHTRRRRD